jgi:lipopolysaccharide heptosyltransferase I
MPEPRILIVRLGSLGDIVHTLPAARALRAAFPDAQLDWIVERRWAPLLQGNPDLNRVIAFDRGSIGGWLSAARALRAASPSVAIDFQGLYKSAALARISGAPRRFGFGARSARESGAAMAYTHAVEPAGAHVIEHNLWLARAAGAKPVALADAEFPLAIPRAAEERMEMQLAASGVTQFFVLNVGGGWGSKCWPAERFGHLHRLLLERHVSKGWRGVVNFGPGERKLAEAVRLVAGEPEPLLLSPDLPQLLALLKRARFVVGADTGPLHLAVALGTPVVGLFGPTDPARNGPCRAADIVVRNAAADETTYKRGRSPAPSMLSISVEQVVAAVERRLGLEP